MLKISKYHQTIIGCSAILTASIASFTPSVSANQTNRINVDSNSPAIHYDLLKAVILYNSGCQARLDLKGWNYYLSKQLHLLL